MRARSLACSTVAVVYMGAGAAVGLVAARQVIPLLERAVDATREFLDARYEW